MLSSYYSSSIRRCGYHHRLLTVAIICILSLSIPSAVDGFSPSSNLKTVRRHAAKNGTHSINKHQSYNEVPLLTSIYNNDYTTSIRSYHNANQSTTLYAKKKSPSSSDDDSSSTSNKWTNPGNLIIAPFVLIFGLDIILNILAITRRTIEYVLTGDVNCIGSWLISLLLQQCPQAITDLGIYIQHNRLTK